MNQKSPSFEERITKAGQSVSLSTSERSAMRSALRKHIERQSPQSKAPLFERFLTWIDTHISPPRPAVVMAVLILLLGGEGVGFAALNSLPGSLLYPVKIEVIEPLQNTFIFSAQEETAWHMALAERRLDEAIQLASEQGLTPLSAQQLITNFTVNANAALVSSATSTENGSIAAQGFVARLGAYDRVFSTLDETHSRVEAGSITAAIQGQIRKENSASSTESSRVAELKDAAKASLGFSSKVVGSFEHLLAPSAAAGARRALGYAAKDATEGEDLLAKKDVTGASRAFKRSLDTSARLSVLARAAATLNIDVFASSSPSTASSTFSATSSPATSTPVLPELEE